jgi:glucosamine--fructose-6-phosphate aminotransferase (isomerizing)
MKERSFLGDILEQPIALKKALNEYPEDKIALLKSRIQDRGITRIVMAGHGSSYNALYPGFIQFCKLSIPVAYWQTAELIKYGQMQIDDKTLLILNSQSGRSIEVETLVTALANKRPACLVALTNYPDSPLGKSSDIIIGLNAGEEHGVAVKTYINPLVLAIIFGMQMNNGNYQQVMDDFYKFSDALEYYLRDYQAKIASIRKLIGNCEHVIVVGRGSSTGAALNGAINQKEAAWNFSEGMNAAEFRHGPLELADEKLTIFILEGDDEERKYNERLASEILSYGSRVIWVGNQSANGIQSISVPEADTLAKPAAEGVAMQFVALALAMNKGIEPGEFRRIGKVVRVQ